MAYSRVKGGSGCPYCSHHKLCPHNNFKALHPELMDERDYEKNSKEGIYPEDYSPGSNKCVSWKCRNNPCGCHEWKAEICYKTGKNKTGCPYCYHKPCPRNNLKILYPELMDERDYEKNSKEGIYPEECTSQTHKEVWWMSRTVCFCL